EPLRNPSAAEFSAFLRGLDPKLRRDLTAPIPGLPQDLLAELRRPEFSALSPKEKVIHIESMVRGLGWYDVTNGEVAEEKADQSPADQMLIAEQRMADLRLRDPSIPLAKRFAGVCTDFTLITVALLREAGIPAGLLSGVLFNGQEAQMRHLHVAAFVPWPELKGGMRIVPVDGTPDSSEEASSARPSLAEVEARAGKYALTPDGKSGAEIAELRKQAKAESVESILQLKNGELERAVNLILHHEVKESHVQAVRRALEAFWYGGVDRGGGNFESESEFLREEVARERQVASPEAAEQPGGASFFAMVRDFVERFKRDPAIDSERKALDLLKSVARQADSGLNDVERRALAAVLSYLGAESMLGANKSSGGSAAGGTLAFAVGVGAGLATLLGASEAQAAVTAVSELGQGGLAGLGVGLASFAVGGIFHWLAKRLQGLKGGESASAASEESPKAVDRQVQSLMSRLANCFSEEKIGLRATLIALGVEAVPALTGFLSHPHYQVRVEAVMALASLQALETADHLRRLLKDPDGFVRAQAAVTLAEWGQI
ncbi:MAG TPA: HEAT repeat domain-containing protein, partial [bacterium]|nr:HEAT repeat domain-containing protein [bacterium]